jgi:valyl-tRNA synthetase
MGHAFQQTLMDALIRYHRMRGFNTNWVVGTDHAGIATEMVVTRQARGARQEQARARPRGVQPARVAMEAAVRIDHHAPDAPPRHLRETGNMPTPKGQKAAISRPDPRMSTAVIEVFVRWYDDGLIYRGKRLVNWDPVLGTAVSDLEVENEDTVGTMWQITYPFVDGPQPSRDKDGKPVTLRGMTIATTRPETMLADGAVAVHPEDVRYRHLVGKLVELPLCDRNIPIVADEMVERDFGTGCVKITGAHDFNDYDAAQRHKLPLIVVMTLDAKINENGPKQFQGMDRYVARKAVVAALEKATTWPASTRSTRWCCRSPPAAVPWSSRCSPTSGS